MNNDLTVPPEPLSETEETLFDYLMGGIIQNEAQKIPAMSEADELMLKPFIESIARSLAEHFDQLALEQFARLQSKPPESP